MTTLGNIIWFVFTGLTSWISWILSGCLCCLTIIGIPFGKQCFKIADLSVWPFDKEVEVDFMAFPVANAIWICFCGWELAVSYFLTGIFWYITILGIPFGKQCFKLAMLSLSPFGAKLH